MSSTVTRRREQRVLVMVVAMVVCYLICWLPYGVTALLATFGPPNLLTPEATITPSLLAKFSTVINPFIYIFMNKQVRKCNLLRLLLKMNHPKLELMSNDLFLLVKPPRLLIGLIPR